MRASTRDLLVDLVVGGVVGGVVGAIAAVNFVIFAGFEEGYETSIAEVFSESSLAGLTTVALLVAGPVLGMVVARRSRHRRKPR